MSVSLPKKKGGGTNIRATWGGGAATSVLAAAAGPVGTPPSSPSLERRRAKLGRMDDRRSSALSVAEKGKWSTLKKGAPSAPRLPPGTPSPCLPACPLHRASPLPLR